MSKSVKTVVITAAIIAQVEAVLQDKRSHKYSVSKIFAAHNAVFGLNETPETCVSCLTKRATALEKWYNSGAAKADEQATAKETKGQVIKEFFDEANTIAGGLDENPNVSDADKAKIEDAQTAATDAIKRTALAVKNKAGEPINLEFTSEDGETGTVKLADGSAAKAGTYTADNGDTIAVQPGGKAKYKQSLI